MDTNNRGKDTILGVVKFEIKVLGVRYSFTTHRRTRRSKAVGQDACEIGQDPQKWNIKIIQIQNHSRTRHLDGHVARRVAKTAKENAQDSANED